MWKSMIGVEAERRGRGGCEGGEGGGDVMVTLRVRRSPFPTIVTHAGMVFLSVFIIRCNGALLKPGSTHQGLKIGLDRLFRSDGGCGGAAGRGTRHPTIFPPPFYTTHVQPHRHSLTLTTTTNHNNSNSYGHTNKSRLRIFIFTVFCFLRLQNFFFLVSHSFYTFPFLWFLSRFV